MDSPPEEAFWTGAVLPSSTGRHVELICEYAERPGRPKLHVLVKYEDVVRLTGCIRAAMGGPTELDS